MKGKNPLGGFTISDDEFVSQNIPHSMAEHTEMPSPHVEGWGSNPNAIHPQLIVVAGKDGAAAATSWSRCKENISREHHNFSGLPNQCELSISL